MPMDHQQPYLTTGIAAAFAAVGAFAANRLARPTFDEYGTAHAPTKDLDVILVCNRQLKCNEVSS